MILEADSIGKSFGARRVLTSASLRVCAGAATVLFGRNGAGKSTLLKIAVGWLGADYGTVRFEGRLLPRPRLAALARAGLFYLPDRDLLEPGIPLGRQLAFAGERARLGGRAAALADVAGGLGLSANLKTPPSRLSGGMLRRAEVAFAMATAPRCLVADEPFRGVSPTDAEALVTAFRGLASAGCAVVVTGHEVETLRALADRIVWCTAGTTHEFASVAAAEADPQFQREYFGREG